jgi:hypothetical protein
MAHTSPKKTVLLALAFLTAGTPLWSTGGKGEIHRLAAAIYQSPPIVAGTTWGGPSKDGGVVGGTTAGMITSVFPEAVVLIKLGGPADFEPSAVAKKIAKTFVFRCGDSFAMGLVSYPLDEFSYLVRDGACLQEAPEGREAVRAVPGPGVSFRFRVHFLSETAEALYVRLEFVSLIGPESLAPEIREKILLDYALKLRPNEPCLVGFPVVQDVRHRHVYWVALNAEPAAPTPSLRE